MNVCWSCCIGAGTELKNKVECELAAAVITLWDVVDMLATPRHQAREFAWIAVLHLSDGKQPGVKMCRYKHWMGGVAAAVHCGAYALVPAQCCASNSSGRYGMSGCGSRRQ